jgi:hypothetical protein
MNAEYAHVHQRCRAPAPMTAEEEAPSDTSPCPLPEGEDSLRLRRRLRTPKRQASAQFCLTATFVSCITDFPATAPPTINVKTTCNPSPCTLALPGRIRTNVREQRSKATYCRGSGSRRLAGGHALAGRKRSQIRPPERHTPSIVPRQPARGNAERWRVSTLTRAYLGLAAPTRIWLVAPPRAGFAARYFVCRCPGVGFASTFDLRARDPRLTSFCRCRGNRVAFLCVTNPQFLRAARRFCESHPVSVNLCELCTTNQWVLRATRRFLSNLLCALCDSVFWCGFGLVWLRLCRAVPLWFWCSGCGQTAL